MKRLLFLILVMWSVSCFAQEYTPANPLADQLGTTAGLAYACKAGKSLEDFEVIASRLLANNAATEKDEKDAYIQYVEAKVRTIKNHEKNPKFTCKEILTRFNKMSIFKFVVYADGSVKMDDGTMLRPKRPVKTVKKNKK